MSNDTMQTGDVSRRIGFPVTEDLLRELGFEPVGTDRRARLWAQSDYEEMCERLAMHVRSRKDVPMQPRPEARPKKEKPAAAASTRTEQQQANRQESLIKAAPQIDLDDEEL